MVFGEYLGGKGRPRRRSPILGAGSWARPAGLDHPRASICAAWLPWIRIICALIWQECLGRAKLLILLACAVRHHTTHNCHYGMFLAFINVINDMGYVMSARHASPSWLTVMVGACCWPDKSMT
jgi:hypothetical protein